MPPWHSRSFRKVFFSASAVETGSDYGDGCRVFCHHHAYNSHSLLFLLRKYIRLEGTTNEWMFPAMTKVAKVS